VQSSLSMSATVSVAVQPDWELAKVLVAQGVPTREIVERCALPSLDALHKRITRGQWARLRTESAKAVSVHVSVSKQDSQGSAEVSEIGEEVRGRLARELKRTTDGLDHLPAPRTPTARKDRAALVAAILGPAKTLFGWGEGVGNLAIRIGLLSSAQTVEVDKGNLKAIGPPAIDIPSVITQEQRSPEP
jgi:hypothetical protein